MLASDLDSRSLSDVVFRFFFSSDSLTAMDLGNQNALGTAGAATAGASGASGAAFQSASSQSLPAGGYLFFAILSFPCS